MAINIINIYYYNYIYIKQTRLVYVAQVTDSTNKPQTEIYMPKIITENPINIEVEEKDYASTLQAAQEGGMIPVKLEEAVVRDRVSHDLYKNASSGLRELFANEAKACRTARRECNSHPRIEVRINNTYRKLTIQGFDSLGIDQQLFVDVVRYLGRSSNFSGKETGQFGFGLASYTCLSDIMILETYSRKTEEKFAVMGKSGVGFQVLPKPKIDSYGTKITMTIKDSVMMHELINALKTFARFSEVDTALVVEDDDTRYNVESGVFELKRETFKEALEAMTKDEHNYKKIIREIPVEIHEDDFELYGNLVVDSWRDDANVEDYSLGSQYHDNIHLLGLPIEADINVRLSNYIINILDERKYKPTPDRERLTEEASKKIERRISEEIAKIFAENEIKDISEYESHPHKAFYAIRNSAHITEYFSDTALEILNFLDTKVATPTSKKTTIGNIITPNSVLVRLGKLKANKINAINKNVPDAITFRVLGDNMYDLTDNPKFNVIDGDDYIIEHGIDAKMQPTGNHTVVIRQITWESDYYSYRTQPSSRAKNTTIFADEMDKSMIRTTVEEGRNLLEIMGLIETDYSIVKNTRKLTKGTLHADFVKSAGRLMVQTNMGVVRLNKIGKSRKVCVVKCDNLETIGEIKTDGSVLIGSDSNATIFKILAFLKDGGFDHIFDADRFRTGSLWKFMKFDDVVDEDGIPAARLTNLRTRNMLEIIHALQTVKDHRATNVLVRLVRTDEMITESIEEIIALDRQLSELRDLAK